MRGVEPKGKAGFSKQLLLCSSLLRKGVGVGGNFLSRENNYLNDHYCKSALPVLVWSNYFQVAQFKCVRISGEMTRREHNSSLLVAHTDNTQHKAQFKLRANFQLELEL